MKVGIALVLTSLLCICCNGQVVEKCRTDTFPPPDDTKLSTVVVNLNKAPEHRWDEAITPYKADIVSLIETITDNVNKYVLEVADIAFDLLLQTLPDPYKSEIKGVAKILGLPEGQVVLYNIFYELFTVCTSIIEEDSNGQLYHARNLDFGLFLGWDNANDTWLMSERLRKIVVNIDFQRDGKTVYQSASFLGYVGLLTAVKQPLFTLTINERFNKEGGFVGIYRWILGNRNAKWMGFLTRDVMESANSYSEAKHMLSTQELLAPAYYILGGNSTGEGVIITRGLNGVEDYQELNITSGRWFLLQTNYDPWDEAPFFDDRRTPGNMCVKQWGQENVGYKSLFNVLSTKPNLNKLTVYSTVMTVRGDIQSWLQQCKTPCTPW
ncbi:acid ceramidase-like [Bolinopsis microptera]|uniref:acid ceramidase-like n=1 Tax=Bolinopsis microptera TaxID=2820187 RepID=UPI003079D911